MHNLNGQCNNLQLDWNVIGMHYKVHGCQQQQALSNYTYLCTRMLIVDQYIVRNSHRLDPLIDHIHGLTGYEANTWQEFFWECFKIVLFNMQIIQHVPNTTIHTIVYEHGYATLASILRL